MTAVAKQPVQIKKQPASSSEWLMNRSFDLSFIGGIPLVGVVSVLVVSWKPSLFGVVLFWDLWLLGYHHVISTYTRLFMDSESRRIHRGLITWLPLLMLGIVVLLAYSVGIWLLTTVYFYWQWWHYSRQSWGVNRVYERKAKLDKPLEDPRIFQLAFYSLPIWGMLWRSSQQHETFLGLEFRSFAVPAFVANIAGVMAVFILGWLTYNRVMAWRRGVFPVAQTLYLVSHFSIFAVAYLITPNLTFGWLAINIWHNAQYIVFVWYYNNRRFKNGVDPKAKLLSRLSQTKMFPLYMLFSLALTAVFYEGLSRSLSVFGSVTSIAIPAIIVYQAVNFHHYVVDSFIWKVRKKPMQKTLGLSSTSSS